MIRRLRDVAYHLRDTYKTIVIASPLMQIAPELSKDVTVIEFGLPGTEDFNRLLDRIIDDVKDNPKVKIELRTKLANDCSRRPRADAQGSRKRFRQDARHRRPARRRRCEHRLQREAAGHQEKRPARILRGAGKFSDVAGLENLKDWLRKRSVAFTDRATNSACRRRAARCCSACKVAAKVCARRPFPALWGLPLLRFDVGRMFSSLVGSSEENVRRAIQVAESVAPVILWIDEIDKALAGAASSAGSDGGTAARVFGTLLTWLSEKTSPVFVIATANDISHLPPELLRKGRLDEIFFVDLPTAAERQEIFRIHSKNVAATRPISIFDELARVSEGFNGAEIEEAVIAGLFDAFSGQTDLNTAILKSRHRRNRAAFQNHERRAEPAAHLGNGSLAPRLGCNDAPYTDEVSPQDRVLNKREDR